MTKATAVPQRLGSSPAAWGWAAATRPLQWLLRAALGTGGLVFMLHRFQHPDLGVEGHNPQGLRWSLAELRRLGYALVDIGEMVRRIATPGESLARTVAFTMDDGYADQAEVGAPVFAEYDCPVTTFVTTGFLDGRLWLWWDQIEYVFRRTRRRLVAVPADGPLSVNGGRLRYRTSTTAERAAAQAAFTAWCKTVPDAVKERAIAALAVAAEVELPARAPGEYAPLSWSQVRRCERAGMTFGPHTVTHPILSQTSNARSREELVGSWNRLRQETGRPVPVFCYPNGEPSDFGDREIETLRALGLLGAVTSRSGYLRPRRGRGTAQVFRLPRFGWCEKPKFVLQCVSGVEGLKAGLRTRLA